MMPCLFTVSVVVRDDRMRYWDGNSWCAHPGPACLFSPLQAAPAIRSFRGGRSGLKMLYVIRNRNFDFFEGTGWTGRLEAARMFDDPAAIESALKRLAGEAAA